MSNVAFVGDIDFLKGFKLFGAGIFAVNSKEEISSILENLANEDYKIVFILENWAKATPDVIERYKDKFVSILIIPDYRRDLGVCNAMIKDAIVEAVGADILKGE